MRELIFTFNLNNIESLGNVRCMEEIQIAIDENLIWLRGIIDTPDIDIKIKQLPAKDTFIINENNLLFAPKSLTPISLIPVLEWKPIKELIKVETPIAAMPGNPNEKVEIKLKQSNLNKNGDALLATLAIWKEYSEIASAIRLEQLKFAVSEKNEVLIVGNPLPPIPGNEYWLENGILLPCGYNFEIPIVADLINKKLNDKNDSILLFNLNGTFQKIDRSFLVKARRSAIRLTKEIHTEIKHE